jgi:protein-tyrosine phosphatase
MGNICRSPLAEGLFLHKVNRRGVAEQFRVDSAGTSGWHEGEPADARMRAEAARHEVTLPSRARAVRHDDFTTFDLIVCMDDANRDELMRMGAPEDRVRMLLAYHPKAPVSEVPDPYYGGAEGFATVFGLVDAACDALLEELAGQ